ncbi:DUF1007 family protein [Thiospirochaeta perfilievii]|uniref:Nickel/cobalt efflux system n=1 Tax=Thiospirochaeta perfilievii TaxID=252967 RepID=A0A5C1QEI9_9SPIO|nr:DUF1007 family protein [Thiospirochaeta perfilievii]QEN05409.1 DUF1007 family protein [Thiospirochaeta perfilievii]
MRRTLLTLLIIFSSINIYSHPHVFIDIGIRVERLDRANISWTFDPIESQNKLYFFDDDGDGLLNKGEIENLYNEGFKSLKDFSYFISVSKDNKNYRIDNVLDFNVTIEKDSRLTFNFSIELPDLGSDKRIAISHFDTSYFIAFSEPDRNDIILGENIYSAVLKNSNKPFYYDPNANRTEILDTSKPQKGWLVAYPTEVFISSEPILDSFGDYKIGFKEKVTQVQRSIYLKLSNKILELQKMKSLKTLFYILFLSLLYGVVHALGPGHRKIVISTYILSRKKISYLKAIGISLTSALIHSGSGVISILLLNLIFNKIKPSFIDNVTNYIEKVSYIGVLLLAIVLIIIKLIPQKDNKESKPVALSLIILSSLVPCPGAITIMLVSLTIGIINVGILTVLAMSLGIGLTLSLISIFTIKGKKIVSGSNKNRFNLISNLLEWMGLIILLIFSLFMVISIS